MNFTGPGNPKNQPSVPMADTQKHFLFTIDVEDWFQAENFKPWIPFSTWDQHSLRVERNVHRILDLLDSMKSAGKREAIRPGGEEAIRPGCDEARRPGSSNHVKCPSFQASKHPSLQASSPPSILASQRQAEGRPKATFFVLGWLAERLPRLVREIKDRGHEVASHGYKHELCNQMPHDDLKADLIKSKKLLEDIIGDPIDGYRAPSFSISDEILEIIADCGYRYDSSYNSFALNSRYGKVDLSQHPKNGIVIQITEDFHELPISNLKISINLKNPTNPSNPNNLINLQPVKFPPGRNEVNFTGPSNPKNSSNSTNPLTFKFPFGGGGYFRLLPFSILKKGIHSILKNQNSYLFYMHPWEIDPEQPRVREASRQYQFRHYINLDKTHQKLIRLIESFQQCRFITCKEYLEKETKYT